MGHGRDNVSPNKRTNDKYAYDVYGVRTMCESYYELREMEVGNWSAVDIRIDLEQALSATTMSEESRLMIGLVYGFNLTIIQAAKLINIKMIEAKEALDEAFEIIEAVMNGYETTFFFKFEDSTANNLDEWLAGVRAGKTMPFDIPENVMENMWNYLISIKDRQVMAILNPKPQEVEDEEDDGFGGYPFYQTSNKIENPSRKGEFNPYKDYDYFREKDRKKVDYYMSLTEPDSIMSNLKVTGHRKTKGAAFAGDGEGDYADYYISKRGKGNIYGY